MKSVTRAWWHACIVLPAALCCAAASAQELSRPAEFYFDVDADVASPIVALEGDSEAVVGKLVRQMERGGRRSELATAQLAHLSMAAGRSETGLALYQRALEAMPDGTARRRSLFWNKAWDLYRQGDLEGALAAWSQAVPGSIVRPAWAPPTLALVLWKLDRRQEAVQWYAAAVRTHPERWQDPATLQEQLPGWSAEDRATLVEVRNAWAKDPPAWP